MTETSMLTIINPRLEWLFSGVNILFVWIGIPESSFRKP